MTQKIVKGGQRCFSRGRGEIQRYSIIKHTKVLCNITQHNPTRVLSVSSSNILNLFFIRTKFLKFCITSSKVFYLEFCNAICKRWPHVCAFYTSHTRPLASKVELQTFPSPQPETKMRDISTISPYDINEAPIYLYEATGVCYFMWWLLTPVITRETSFVLS
jgi:hypothetical protein